MYFYIIYTRTIRTYRVLRFSVHIGNQTTFRKIAYIPSAVICEEPKTVVCLN